ncbi:MAG: undecaprenyl-diphosphate phosphatase, partial [bacterium]|nr:undecaprenyl-diphosphate phosphatase [bacterium]
MNLIQAIILSVIEGLTEFLPVSSTGHLILASSLLHIFQSNFVKSFEIVIQLGAIMAVVGLYGQKVIFDVKLWPKILIAFFPSAVVGLVAYPFIKTNLIGNTSVVVWSLFLGGLVL